MLRNSLLVLIFVTGPALADPQDDVDYIVSQTVTQTLFEAALRAQGPMIASAVQKTSEPKGSSYVTQNVSWSCLS